MDKLGVLLVSYGAREVAMADTLLRSKNHNVQLYIADKQCNPYNAKHAAKHAVIPSLDVNEICRFAEANKASLDFVLVGSENPSSKASET
jgi:phosphoribosylamine-glycine ligase